MCRPLKKNAGKNINKERKEKKCSLVGGQRARSSSSNTRLVQQHDDLTMYSHSVAVLHPAVSREDSHSHQTDTCWYLCCARHSNLEITSNLPILLCAALSTLSRTRVSLVGMLQCISLATRTRCINVRSRFRVRVRVLVCMCALAVPTARVRARVRRHGREQSASTT